MIGDEQERGGNLRRIRNIVVVEAWAVITTLLLLSMALRGELRSLRAAVLVVLCPLFWGWLAHMRKKH